MTDENFNNNQNPNLEEEIKNISETISEENIEIVDFNEPDTLKEPQGAESPQEVPPVLEEAPKYVYHWDASVPDPVKKPKKKQRGAMTFAIVMSVAFALALIALVCVLFFAPGNTSTEPTSYTELFEKCAPFTVSIQTQAGSIGSGFFIEENGRLLTNYHVVEGNTTVSVHTYDGETYTGEVVGSNENIDIAIVDIVSNGKDLNFTTAKFADSNNVKTGEAIIAIGCPEDIRLGWTLTTGYVSATKRTFTSGGSSRTLIQFDAPVNPGNSGGPLINAKGEVIGIIQSKASETTYVYDINNKVIGYVEDTFEGIGFAIPANTAKTTVDEIMSDVEEQANIPKPQLGINGFDVYAGSEYFITQNTRIPVQTDTETGNKYIIQNGEIIYLTDERLNGELIAPEVDGIWVVGTTVGSDAHGKLQKGDIITKFDGIPLNKNQLYFEANASRLFDLVTNRLKEHKIGDTLTVEVYRGGETVTLTVTLTKK